LKRRSACERQDNRSAMNSPGSVVFRGDQNTNVVLKPVSIRRTRYAEGLPSHRPGRILRHMKALPMRPAERDALLIVLAITAGSTDGWSFFGMGHAFVANMTGNTVLLGLAAFQINGDVLHPLLALVLYLFGVTLAAFLTRNAIQGSRWPKMVSRVLLFEAILLTAAEIGWVQFRGHAVPAGSPIPPRMNLLLILLAFAIGMQSGAMLQLKIPGIVTTYITGTWTSLMTGIVRLATREKREPAGERLRFEERLLLQCSVLAAYFLSAVFTGCLFRYIPVAVGALSAGSALLVAAYAIVRT
jgi:uncharacterized membrane protein YoaK (UPF0700 family)